MKELASILSLKQPEELIDQLAETGYSFAVWRMPNSTESKFIISLTEPTQLPDFQIANTSPGFLINAFGDNHPIKPYFISADIIITNQNVEFSPNISDVQIDAFKEQINTRSKSKNQSNKTSQPTSNAFEALVERAVAEIQKGTFEKVVLSRFKDEEIPSDFSSWQFFETISAQYENAFCSLSFIPGKGMWIGASPELLISDDHDSFKTVALAGTKRLGNGQKLSEIAWTQKEIEEQALVSRYIINCFKKIRLREFHEHGPKTIQAGNLAHLKTEFVVDYSEVTFEDLADQMLELLHPTSAVCGMPIEHAKPWIKEVENYDREFYSGFLGPVNFEDATSLFVNLRCMKVMDGYIRFFAGAGLTEDSDPQKEYEETEIKMNVLESLLT
ncbi:isochorismate synthase [Ekhidna lutea]|uniref:isochorismate synthase n=1 Tax=Ekhidna lutea TaxID=447679 RepID=A0A239GRY4_EKHLU|nr:isochorismate synthase [Ekhidna lutea]SNS71538.1 isochorismate synthase [Ekhidna lutea]